VSCLVKIFRLDSRVASSVIYYYVLQHTNFHWPLVSDVAARLIRYVPFPIFFRYLLLRHVENDLMIPSISLRAHLSYPPPRLPFFNFTNKLATTIEVVGLRQNLASASPLKLWHGMLYPQMQRSLMIYTETWQDEARDGKPQKTTQYVADQMIDLTEWLALHPYMHARRDLVVEIWRIWGNKIFSCGTDVCRLLFLFHMVA
jgi:hypothetical protein